VAEDTYYNNKMSYFFNAASWVNREKAKEREGY
jgi:hypothetical protein